MGSVRDERMNKKNLPRPASRGLKVLIAALWLLALAGFITIISLNVSVNGSDLVQILDGGLVIGLAFILLAFVGALAAMGQPRNSVGWVLLSSGLAIQLAGLAGMWSDLLLGSQSSSGRAPFLGWLGGIGWYTGLFLLLLVFPFLFPDGRLPNRRWRPVFAGALIVGGIIIGYTLVAPFFSPQRFDLPSIEERLGPFLLLSLLFGGLGVVSLVVRYRASRGDVRIQMKWLLVAVGFPVLGFLLIAFIEDATSIELSNIIWGLFYLSIPLGLGIALLRYRMFDVDTLIRKTAVYGALTVLLALVYFGIVIVLQRLLSPFTGESSAAVVLSTLLIAALFLPLRRRVQDVIDRRFYRKKYDAEKVLAAFAATVRDETDLDALTTELLRVIQETMQPDSVSIWLKDTKTRPPLSAETIN
jgi:MFS family permease